MNPSNKRKKTRQQLEIQRLDELIWSSSPLGKFMSNINKRSNKDCPSFQLKAKNNDRSWIVRIPASFVFTGAKTGGFQTIVIAETLDQAWDEAYKSNEWEILKFKVSHLCVFPKEPL